VYNVACSTSVYADPYSVTVGGSVSFTLRVTVADVVADSLLASTLTTCTLAEVALSGSQPLLAAPPGGVLVKFDTYGFRV